MQLLKACDTPACCSFNKLMLPQAKAFIQAIERNSAFVGRARDAATFSPKDTAAVDEFLAAEYAARQVGLPRFVFDFCTELRRS